MLCRKENAKLGRYLSLKTSSSAKKDPQFSLWSLQFVCQKDYTKAKKLHFTKLLGVVKHRQKKEKPNKFGVKLENGKLAQGFSL